jgi:peptide/nickel transport system substrate-binding protein
MSHTRESRRIEIGHGNRVGWSGPAVLLAVSALLALSAGCEPAARQSGRIVIGVNRDLGVLLPPVEASALDAEVNEMLYLGLNSARWVDGALEYSADELCLSEGWEFDPDSTTLTYRLRSDATWSDGHPIDADDVVFTFELIRRPEISSLYIDFWEHLDSVVAVGPHRVAFHFSRRYPRMLFHTGIGIAPAHVFEDAATDQATLTNHPSLLEPGGGNLVVSGPFTVAEWRRGDRLILAPNPAATTARPELAEVVFRVIPEETTRRVELENGTLDVAHPISVQHAEAIRADPRFRIETVDERFYDYIAWNPDHFAAFGDPDVRRALSLAIDRRAILEGLGIDEYAQPAAGPYPPIFRRLRDPATEPDPHLPDSARSILASEGWRDTDGDGVLERRGQPFRFTLLTDAANDRRTAAAEILQSQLGRVGVAMELRTAEFGTVLDQVFGGREFEAVLLGWQVALEPDYLVGHFWPPDHQFNITGYASAELDTLIALARDAATDEQAAPHWRSAARVISGDRPYAFLWFFDDLVAVNQRVENTRIDTYGVYQNLHRWRVAE